MNSIAENVEHVRADQIPWKLAPIARLEDRTVQDLLDLEHEDLAVYTYDLQCDLRTVRGLFHDTLGALSVTANQRDKAIATVRLGRRS